MLSNCDGYLQGVGTGKNPKCMLLSRDAHGTNSYTAHNYTNMIPCMLGNNNLTQGPTPAVEV